MTPHRELPYISFYKLEGDWVKDDIAFQAGIYREEKNDGRRDSSKRNMDDDKTGVRITHGSSPSELAKRLISGVNGNQHSYWNCPAEGACPKGWVPLSDGEVVEFLEQLGLEPSSVKVNKI